MTFSSQLWRAATDVRAAAMKEANPLERRRLRVLADVIDGEYRVQKQRETPRQGVVHFIPTEPLRRLG